MHRLPYLTGLLIVLILIFSILDSGFVEEIDRSMIRWTARISFLCFIIAFSATPVHRLFNLDLTHFLVRYRRYLGLSFAVSHTFHLLFILLLQFYFDAHNFEKRGLLTVAGGGLAYVLMYLMAFTSTDNMIAKLGANRWKILHTIGSYYILIVFSVSYIPRAISDSTYMPFGIVIIVAVILKMLSLIVVRNKS